MQSLPEVLKTFFLGLRVTIVLAFTGVFLGLILWSGSVALQVFETELNIGYRDALLVMLFLGFVYSIGALRRFGWDGDNRPDNPHRHYGFVARAETDHSPFTHVDMTTAPAPDVHQARSSEAEVTLDYPGYTSDRINRRRPVVVRRVSR